MHLQHNRSTCTNGACKNVKMRRTAPQKVATRTRDATRVLGKQLAVRPEKVERVRAVPAARGSSGVMMPGDFEAAARKTRAREGIRISSATWADLLTVAERLGVVAP